MSIVFAIFQVIDACLFCCVGFSFFRYCGKWL